MSNPEIPIAVGIEATTSSTSSTVSVTSSYYDWDPTLPQKNRDSYVDIASETSRNIQCLPRIKRDMMAIYNDPPPGIFVVHDEQDLTLIHALIHGSFDTPYEGGFFYFVLRCPADYPIKPPKVKFMTTAAGNVRFNPNLYKCGKVCISILGTWPGPAWSPALTISSVLISIQSLLTENPYHNEPGFERERFLGDSKRYNEIIQHETIRVAVCGMIDNDYGLHIPDSLVDAMNQSFLQFFDYYESTVKRQMHLSGQVMQDPFGEKRGIFEYDKLMQRLEKIHERVTGLVCGGAALEGLSESPPSPALSGSPTPSSPTQPKDEASYQPSPVKSPSPIPPEPAPQTSSPYTPPVHSIDPAATSTPINNIC